MNPRHATTGRKHLHPFFLTRISGWDFRFLHHCVKDPSTCYAVSRGRTHRTRIFGRPKQALEIGNLSPLSFAEPGKAVLRGPGDRLATKDQIGGQMAHPRPDPETMPR